MALPSTATMDEVHTAWLNAGANDDVGTMHQLWIQFPEWLDFQRQVGSATSDSSLERQARFCSWGGFHLSTIGASALHTAAWNESLGIMEFLLESGQSPDEADDSGMIAMMVAILRLNLMTMRCVLRDGEAVRRNLVVDWYEEQDERVSLVIRVIMILLQYEANVDDGKTALHCSTGDDAYEVSKLLLDVGANINALDESGKSPLYYCVQEGGLLVTELLLSHGATIDLEDKEGVSPLTLVLQLGNVSVLQLFLNHHQCVATAQRLDFAGAVLLQAVDNRQEEVVRYIVENEYASVTVRNAAGETPLHRAILRKSPSLMELLADFDPAGDNLTTVTMKSETPAHYAAQSGSYREVEMLLQCLTSVYGDLQELEDANPLNAIDQRGRTSLYITATAPYHKQRINSLRGASTAANHDERDVKSRLLLHHGAHLFPPDFLVQKLALGNSNTGQRIIFPVKVQRCLRNWVVEIGACRGEPEEPEDEEVAQEEPADDLAAALTELCVRWMSSVVCVGSCCLFLYVQATHTKSPRSWLSSLYNVWHSQIYYVNWRSLPHTNFIIPFLCSSTTN